MTSFPSSFDYRRAAGIKNRQQPKRPKKVRQQQVGRVSARLESALLHWWGYALSTGRLCHGALEEGYDWRGGDRDWPDLVSVGALAQSATRLTGVAISKSVMGVWMHYMGVQRRQIEIVRRNHRGRITYRTTQTFYNVGYHRTNQ